MFCRSHLLEYIVSLPGGESVISLCLEGGGGGGGGGVWGGGGESFASGDKSQHV